MAPHGPYSHSRMECFRRCPRKYRLRYVEKIPSRRRGIEAFMGSRVHEALEHLYRELGEGRPVDQAELLAHYHARWQEAFDDDVLLVREELSPDHYRGVGETCLLNYYRLNHPFADAARTLGLEQLVEFHLDGQDRYPIRGYIDRMVRGNDDVLEIHDYKTSNRMPRPRDFAADGQLALYQIGLGHVFEGQQGVRLVWHYLAHGERVELQKTAAELDALCEQTRATIEAIGRERRWGARVGALCRWCSYEDICPEGRRLVEARQTASWSEAGLVWRYAGIKQAAGEPETDATLLRREAELLRVSIRDYVARTRRTVLQGAPGRLVVQPPADEAARWVMRFEEGPAGPPPA